MKKIAAVIIEDEAKSMALLCNMVREYCPQVEIIGTGTSVASGIATINKLRPDLVFLDIAMPDGDGFELLEKTGHLGFNVIFVTAYDEYATRAFEFAALHYLLKPINIEELEKAVARFTNVHQKNVRLQQYEILQQGNKKQFSRIALPSISGYDFIDINDIVRCEANKSYTIFFLKNKSQIVVSKSLNNYEKLLENCGFFRIHRKHLVNLNYIDRYVRGKGGYILLNDGFKVDVSVRKKEVFLERMSKLTGFV